MTFQVRNAKTPSSFVYTTYLLIENLSTTINTIKLDNHLHLGLT